ncbi:hypothetical protein OH687_31370 [Burkholderia anthina]|nr:hypothetical protein OH687_31370 [Burkholderia anthina]
MTCRATLVACVNVIDTLRLVHLPKRKSIRYARFHCDNTGDNGWEDRCF